MNRFKKLNKIKSFYEHLVGPLTYQRRLEEVSCILKENEMRVRSQKVKDCQIQTDEVEIELSDLKGSQIEKLLFLLQQRF